MAIQLSSQSIQGILLDVEGTTTPISFVYHTLFPHARTNVQQFLERNFGKPEIQMSIKILREGYDKDRSYVLPSWKRGAPQEKEIQEIVSYVHWLMDQDRKTTGLKLLQGFIWQEGYQQKHLQGKIFQDVPPALEQWKKSGIKIGSFSSGSILAQQLCYTHSEFGDLSPFFWRFFDTTTGPKNSRKSYEAIAGQMEIPAEKILYLSDVTSELDSAKIAGMQTLLSIRPGNRLSRFPDHPSISSFEEILLEEPVES